MSRSRVRRAIPREPQSVALAPGETLVLPRRSETPWTAVGKRAALAGSCIVIAALIVYVQRSDYSNSAGEDISLLDAFYFATVSLSTTGYGDIAPITPWARLVNILVITPLRLIFLITLVGSTVEVLTNRGRLAFREQRWRKSLRDHTVIIGFGVKGRAVAQTLLENGFRPDRMVVIGKEPDSVGPAIQLGCAAIVGDARNDAVLADAGIDTARTAVIATDNDDTTVLITLALRRLSPTVKIVAAAREMQHAPAMRQSGADTIIPGAEASGRLMAVSLLSPDAGDVMIDLLDPTEGLRITQRPVTGEEIGAHPHVRRDGREVVLGVIRDGRVHRFEQAEVDPLRPDDQLIVIRVEDEDEDAAGQQRG